MALIALAADKGAPGVTTTAVALAAVWPRQVLLAECDPAGGDLVYRLPAKNGRPLMQDRGVMSLASAVHGQAGQVGPDVVWEHAQELDGGLPVLVGPTLPEQAAAMASAWTPISGLFAGLADADVIADCGRVLGETPLVPVLRRADLILFLAEATVEGVAHLRHGLGAAARAVTAAASSSSSALTRTAVLLVAGRDEQRSAVKQVRQVLAETPGLGEVPVLGALAFDPEGARGLSGQWGRRLDRSPLIVSARAVAGDVHTRVADAAVDAALSA